MSHDVKILFTKPKKFGIISWIIRKVERTEYSHVATSWKSRDGSLCFIYEAQGTSLHFTSERVFKKRVDVVKEYSLSICDETKKSLLEYCVNNAGVDYGFKQLIGIGYVRFMSSFGKSVKNPYSDGRRSQVCSELVGGILQDVLGYDIEADLDVASPKDIDRLLQELSYGK